MALVVLLQMHPFSRQGRARSGGALGHAEEWTGLGVSQSARRVPLAKDEVCSFVQGGWESDEDTVEAAALRETVEEAGVRGVLVSPELGTFDFTSKKQRNFSVNTCRAHIFAMRVMEQLESWPEQAYRKRHWVTRCMCDCLSESQAWW